MKNLTIRPELRGDGSANDGPFAHEEQLTAAFDVVDKFLEPTERSIHRRQFYQTVVILAGQGRGALP
ncbi:MAG TPA: hypothetical protein PKY77_03320 [Phycisphaerae bacterium]|nr:hypothetical protein [Phycisphaerae bacterium]HRY67371.1 hypothetical protein [Phycisphaerae bacterium]HSA29337.1 hypothetical protein [Phycisphaerae bacterium]